MSTHNPYAAPSAQVANLSIGASAQPLAERGTRLGAQLIDGLIAFSCAIPGLIGFLANMEDPSVVMILVSVALFLGLVIIQLVLLFRESRTLGKKFLKIRIVRMTGEPTNGWRILGLRMIVPGILGGIPFLGMIFSLVDILFIFREDRRCIHDLIADTRVVVSP